MGHANEDLIRRGYDAFGRGDVGTLDELFADDVTWHSPGRNVLSGDYEGKQAVFELFGRVAELSGGTWRFEIHDVLADDEHAVALVKGYGERNGVRLEDHDQVHVLHLREGKVTEFWAASPDPYATDEFWS